MKSYEETLNSINKKAAKLFEKRKRQKEKVRIVICSIVPTLLVVWGGIAVGVSGLMSRYNNPVITDANIPSDTTNQIQTDNTTIETLGTDSEPSIFPEAWRTMNAFIIQWGEPTDNTYSDWGGYTGAPLKVNYTSVSVTIIKCFSSTVRNNYDENEQYGYGDSIKTFSYLMVPNDLLNEINSGDISLVFIKFLYSKGHTDSDGTPLTAINSQGNYVEVLEYTFTPEFITVPGAVFDPIYAVYPVIDNKLRIPDSAYRLREYGNYYSHQMSLLQYANRLIKLYSLDRVPVFQSGMTVEEIEEFFDFFCNSNYH